LAGLSLKFWNFSANMKFMSDFDHVFKDYRKGIFKPFYRLIKKLIY